MAGALFKAHKFTEFGQKWVFNQMGVQASCGCSLLKENYCFSSGFINGWFEQTLSAFWKLPFQILAK